MSNRSRSSSFSWTTRPSRSWVRAVTRRSCLIWYRMVAFSSLSWSSRRRPAKLGFAKAMSNGWVEVVDKKSPDGARVVRKVATISDEVQMILAKIQQMKLDDVPEKSMQDLKKRKLISEMYFCCCCCCWPVVVVDCWDVIKQNFNFFM